MERPASPFRSVSLPNKVPTLLTHSSSSSTITNASLFTDSSNNSSPSLTPSGPLSPSIITTNNNSNLPFPIQLRRSNSSSSTLSSTFSKPFARVFPQKLAGIPGRNGGPLVVDTVPKELNERPKEFRDIQVRYGSGHLDGDAPMPGFSFSTLEEESGKENIKEGEGTIVLQGRDWIMPRCEAEVGFFFFSSSFSLSFPFFRLLYNNMIVQSTDTHTLLLYLAY